MSIRLIAVTPHNYGPRRPPRADRYASPIMRELCQHVMASLRTGELERFCNAAGINKTSFLKWRRGGEATMSRAQAVLEECGYEIVIRKREP